MEAIAAEAGVSLKTAYLTYATKPKLLRAVWDLLLKGDTGDAPVAARASYHEVMAEPDPQRRLRLNARNAAVVKQRIGGILRVIRSAAPVETEMASLWALIQSDFHGNQKAILEPRRGGRTAAGRTEPGAGRRHALDFEPSGRVAAVARRTGLDPGRVRDLVGRHQLRTAVTRPVLGSDGTLAV